MAVTSGQGNPKWTREELILALELYHRMEPTIPGPKDERVINLSEELRALPYHSEEARKPSFRNPDGVAFKLQNLRQVATGRGLKNTAKGDREIWELFGDDPNRTRIAAARIREGLQINQEKADEPEDEEFLEGRAVTDAHKRIERNRKLRASLLSARQRDDLVECDICGLRGDNLSKGLKDAVFEAHHRLPLSTSGRTKTKLSDMSLLCANCHRLLHRAIAIRQEWIDIPDAGNVIYGTGAIEDEGRDFGSS